MKEISHSPRSSAPKVTGKSLQRVLISSGLSIALCMGCIAGSAWSLFQSDFTLDSAGRLSLTGLNPKIVDNEGRELQHVSGDSNTFLLKSDKEYKLSLYYLSTEDDLGEIWDVDALLSFQIVGEVQLQNNDDLPPTEPETQPTEPSEPVTEPENTEPETEETTGTPETPDASESTPEEDEKTPEEEPEEVKPDQTDDVTEDETTNPNEETEKTEEENTETTENTNTEPEDVNTQSDVENSGTEGESSKSGGDGTETDGDTSNDEDAGNEGGSTNTDGTNTGVENPSTEETTEEEDTKEKDREDKIRELQKMLEHTASGNSIDYPIPMVRDENSNSFSVEGISVRQDTLVTFKTVKLISAEASAKAAAFSFDTVPNYYQNDYPDTMYGSGTVASSGCSAVSLAMIATYMTDHPYLPDEMARYFGGAAENNIARLEKGLQTLQIPYEKPANIDIAYEELLKGKVGIALMDYNSYFTNSQHFIVLKGVTEDGKILVNDPNRDNESIYPIGFSEGFTKGTITTGYLGAWLFDKSQMPEEPFIYHVPEPVHGIPRYPDIRLTASQKQVIAKIVYLEARGESPEGQQAVAEVVLNRLASNRFGLTLKDVIFGEGQFRTTDLLDTADPYQAQYDAIEQAIWGPYVLPSDIYYFAREPMTNNVWGKIGNHVFTGVPIRKR